MNITNTTTNTTTNTSNIMNKPDEISSFIKKTGKYTYQQIIISIACFIFFITMGIFWYFTPKQTTVYPPVMSNCPTGWTINENGTCNIPSQGMMNLGNLNGKSIYKLTSGGVTTYSTDPTSGGMVLKDIYGRNILGYTKNDIPGGYDVSNIQTPVIDFTSQQWGQYGSVLCANYNWATKHNIEWEGITNYNQC